jgi:hypothetical protein
MTISPVVYYLISFSSKYTPQHFTIRYGRVDITPTSYSGGSALKFGPQTACPDSSISCFPSR